MLTSSGHLTYCTNIHPGENWSAHFEALKENFPSIKDKLAPQEPMGIGLRLSNEASIELTKGTNLEEFKDWLKKVDGYVFTMNGFPYGDFHHTVVKDQVHSPDWISPNRLSYTLGLMNILSELLPEGMDGGISTSPLSYRHWFSTLADTKNAVDLATKNIIQVAEQMHAMKMANSKILHLDIEPEPDGLIETGEEFIDWYTLVLLPMARDYFKSEKNLSAEEADSIVKEHIRICYDVCHFALGFEDHSAVINHLTSEGIKIGKFQISAALKALLPVVIEDRNAVSTAFSEFNEPVYLHQVIARKDDSSILRYRDLPEALDDIDNVHVKEWRAHFHVPIFMNEFEGLQSTQSEIIEVLSIQEELQLTQHFEVETYTWGVLPSDLKLPIHQSITRELEWVLPLLEKGF